RPPTIDRRLRHFSTDICVFYADFPPAKSTLSTFSTQNAVDNVDNSGLFTNPQVVTSCDSQRAGRKSAPQFLTILGKSLFMGHYSRGQALPRTTPKNEEERKTLHDNTMNSKEQALSTLTALSIPYAYYEHAPAHNMEDSAEFDRLHGISSDVSHVE